MKRLIALGLTVIGLNFFQANQAQAQTAIQGVLTVTVTVILATPIPQGGFVACHAEFASFEATSGTNSESLAIAATVSGGLATCTMPIPYYWTLSTPATDSISVIYGAEIVPGSASSAGLPLRSGQHGFPAIVGVPPTGTHWFLHATTKL
jgi:hypothetical protein